MINSAREGKCVAKLGRLIHQGNASPGISVAEVTQTAQGTRFAVQIARARIHIGNAKVGMTAVSVTPTGNQATILSGADGRGLAPMELYAKTARPAVIRAENRSVRRGPTQL